LKEQRHKGDSIVIYDGECMLCSNAIRWILKFEKDQTLKFATLESDSISDIPIGEDRETIFFYSEGRVHNRSTAIFKIAKHFRSPWSWVRFFGVLPKALTDTCYRLIAKNRYRLFGKVDDVCVLPQTLGDRYID